MADWLGIREIDGSNVRRTNIHFSGPEAERVEGQDRRSQPL